MGQYEHKPLSHHFAYRYRQGVWPVYGLSAQTVSVVDVLRYLPVDIIVDGREIVCSTVLAARSLTCLEIGED